MKKCKYIFLVVSIMSLIACDNNSNSSESTVDESEMVSNEVDVNKMNRKNLKALIKEREEALEKGDTPDNRKKLDLIKAYLAYGNRFKAYKYADDYMFKGARLCSEVGKIAESIKYFDKLYNNFPDFEDRPLALFMKAFVLENHAQNLEEAKLVYEQFLREYPTHDMSDDAKVSIENLGKTPEEIIRGFEIKDSLEKAQSAT